MVYNGNKKFINENYLLCAVDLRLEELDKISEGNEILMDFKKDIEKINDDEDFVKWMSYEEEQEKIKNTLIQDGYDAGVEKGEKTKQFEIAKNMLQENIELNIISKVTGLSLEEIDELK